MENSNDIPFTIYPACKSWKSSVSQQFKKENKNPAGMVNNFHRGERESGIIDDYLKLLLFSLLPGSLGSPNKYTARRNKRLRTGLNISLMRFCSNTWKWWVNRRRSSSRLHSNLHLYHTETKAAVCSLLNQLSRSWRPVWRNRLNYEKKLCSCTLKCTGDFIYQFVYPSLLFWNGTPWASADTWLKLWSLSNMCVERQCLHVWT